MNVENESQCYEETGLIKSEDKDLEQKIIFTHRGSPLWVKINISLKRWHRIARLTFVRNHVVWNDKDSNKVLVSTGRFCLYQSDGQKYENDLLRGMLQFLLELLPFGGGSVMIWAETFHKYAGSSLLTK